MTIQKRKRQICKPSDIIVIPLYNEKQMYAKKYKTVLGFYDFVTDEPITDVTILKDKKILFHGGVYKDILSSGVWPKIGKLPFKDDEEKYGPVQFIYDELNDKFQYYHKGKVYGKPVYSECYNLEPVVAWDRGNIEDRLINYTKTHYDHPRIWDRALWNDNKIKKAWKELYNPDILVDVLALMKKADEEGRYKDMPGI